MALGKGTYNKSNATFTSLRDDKTFSKGYITLRYFWGHGKRGGVMATGIQRLPLKNWKFNDSKKTINYGKVKDKDKKGFIVIKCNSDKEYEKAKQVVLKKKPTTKKKTATKKKTVRRVRKAPTKKKTTSKKKKAPAQKKTVRRVRKAPAQKKTTTKKKKAPAKKKTVRRVRKAPAKKKTTRRKR